MHHIRFHCLFPSCYWQLASDLHQICRCFCSRSSRAAIRSFDIEFIGPEFGLGACEKHEAHLNCTYHLTKYVFKDQATFVRFVDFTAECCTSCHIIVDTSLPQPKIIRRAKDGDLLTPNNSPRTCGSLVVGVMIASPVFSSCFCHHPRCI